MQEIGMDRVPYIKNSSLLEHSLRSSKILESFNASDVLIKAALFHSVYGKVNSPVVPLLNREMEYDGHQLCKVIGADAEKLVRTFCTISDYDLYAPNSSWSLGEANLQTKTDLMNLDFAVTADHVIDDLFNADTFNKLSVFLRFKKYLLPGAQKLLLTRLSWTP